MKNGTESQELSLEQIGNLAGYITSFLVKALSAPQVLYWLGHKTELKQKLYKVFEVAEDSYVTLREEWQKFYKDQFNWDVDFGRVIIPPKPSVGTWRLLIIAQGMTSNKVYAQCEKLFGCWRYEKNLDTAVSINLRTAQNHYAVWVLDGIEPDAEFLGKSTRDTDPDMKIGVTLLERLIQELKYFIETGKHLDISGVTFCSGSRYADGDVPCMDWNPYDGRMRVGWYDAGGSSAKRGVRRAVYS